MKTNLRSAFIFGLLVMLFAAGCNRSRLHSQDSQPAGSANNSPSAAQPAAGLKNNPTQPPAATLSQDQSQFQPDQPSAVPQATLTEPAASASELSPAADDLMYSLDGLSQNLNSTDTLDDFK